MKDIIFERTSVRKFKEKPVETEKLDILMKAAMAAPSAGNQQPWEFYIVTKSETLQALSSTSKYAGCVGEAPAAIVVCYHTNNLVFPDYAQIDCSIACENILLEAVNQGLGAVLLGIAPIKERMDGAAKVLDMPEELTAFSIIACGYPKEPAIQQDRYDEDRIHYITE